MIMQRPTSGPVPVSTLWPVEPLDRGFNIAVHHIANRLNPRGWRVSILPYALDLEGINDDMRVHGRLTISCGHSDHTIFADPETNYAFRAWHDWCHWKLQAPFNLEGEKRVWRLQEEQLVSVYGCRPAHYWLAILKAEVWGQSLYMDYHGQFPTDQVGFVTWYANGGSVSRVFH